MSSAPSALSWQPVRRVCQFAAEAAVVGSCGSRYFSYSAYDSICKPPKRRGTSHASHSSIAPDASKSNINVNNNSCEERGQWSVPGWGRGRQSASERVREAKQIFPETLKSGRYKQQNTKSQRLYEGQTLAGESAPDRRFYRKLEDYREVQDDDPYASVFGESVRVKRRRVKEWQRQFEEENEDVELPYERSNVLARIAPNWFVRYFLNMRDKGGADNLRLLFLCVVVVSLIMWLIGYFFYTSPSQARPIAELR